MSKRLTRIVLTLVVAFSITSCGQKQLSNVELGNKNQILHLGNGTEPQGIDPHLTTGMPEANITEAVLEGLTGLDAKTLEIHPAVAESWAISADGKSYTFKLRKDAKWSNGDTVIASDFVYAWKRALSPSLGNLYAYMLFYIENAERYNKSEITDFTQVGVKAIDDHTLSVTLKAPTHFFLQLLAHHSFFPVHPATIESFGGIDNRLSKWTLPGNFVGNGPFILNTWEVNKILTVKKSDTYWDAKNVTLQEIHFYPIEDTAAEERAFRSGQLHVTNTVPIEKVSTYHSKNPELIRSFPIYGSYFYLINTTRPPFNDKNVRKAISYAIDREQIVKRITKGGQLPSYSLVPSDPTGYKPSPLMAYDIKKAQAFLSAAGFPNGEGFPPFEILYNTQDGHRKIAIAIQNMLKRNLNVQVNLLNQEWKVYLTSTDNKEYDLARQGWIGDFSDPSNFFELMLSDIGNNRTGWKNPVYDQLMQEATHTADTEKRTAIFDRLNEILADEMPVIPIYVYTNSFLVQPSVRNWQQNVLIRPEYKSVRLEVTQ